MTRDNRRRAIRLEVRLGNQALEAARSLREMKLFNDCLSRLYYGLFHHVTALLLTEGVEPKRHSSLPGLLGKHFRESGILSPLDIAVVSRTCTFRELADYERTFDADGEVVERAFDEVEPLVGKVTQYLHAHGWLDGPA